MAKKKKRVVKKLLKRKPRSKKVLRKQAKKKSAKKKPVVTKKRKQGVVGTITHYFPKVRAAVIKLKAPLAIGDTIKIKGHTTDFIQKVSSMQIDHVPVNSAKKGEEIGLLVDSRVRQHDVAYREKGR